MKRLAKWLKTDLNWVFIGLSYILAGAVTYGYFKDYGEDRRLIIPCSIMAFTVTTLYHIYLAKRMKKLINRIKDFANFTFNKMVKR